jgi:hypothetical protein
MPLLTTYYHRDMWRILNEITRAYPSLAIELSSLPADDMSDSRLMSELGSHVVDLFEAGRAEDVRPAFEFAEQLIVSGSDGERHVAMVGFLETVQSIASHRKCGSAAFERFLGPSSRRAWAELNNVWLGKKSRLKSLLPKPEQHRAALVAVLEKARQALTKRVAQGSPKPRIAEDHRADHSRVDHLRPLWRRSMYAGQLS